MEQGTELKDTRHSRPRHQQVLLNKSAFLFSWEGDCLLCLHIILDLLICFEIGNMDVIATECETGLPFLLSRLPLVVAVCNLHFETLIASFAE